MRALVGWCLGGLRRFRRIVPRPRQIRPTPRVLFPVFGGCFGGQRFFVHFVGRCFGFGSLILVIVMQRVLQIVEFRRFDELVRDRFFRFFPVFGLRLRFFVLGLGQLFGERGYFLVGKARAVVGLDFWGFRKLGSGSGWRVARFPTEFPARESAGRHDGIARRNSSAGRLRGAGSGCSRSRILALQESAAGAERRRANSASRTQFGAR